MEQCRSTQPHARAQSGGHVCRPGWRQATLLDGPPKPIIFPSTRTSSPPGTIWLCSCGRVWIAYLRRSERAEPDGPIRWRREGPWDTPTTTPGNRARGAVACSTATELRLIDRTDQESPTPKTAGQRCTDIDLRHEIHRDDADTRPQVIRPATEIGSSLQFQPVILRSGASQPGTVHGLVGALPGPFTPTAGCAAALGATRRPRVAAPAGTSFRATATAEGPARAGRRAVPVGGPPSCGTARPVRARHRPVRHSDGACTHALPCRQRYPVRPHCRGMDPGRTTSRTRRRARERGRRRAPAASAGDRDRGARPGTSRFRDSARACLIVRLCFFVVGDDPVGCDGLVTS